MIGRIFRRDIGPLAVAEAPDVAPAGLAATGNPLFNRSWTALGTPCLGFPAGMSGTLPLGLQFVGPTGSDRALLERGASVLARVGVALPAVD